MRTKVSRRGFMQTALATAAAGALGRQVARRAAAGAAAPTHKLNVLLLLTDDQGPQLECLGTRGIRTPATNELARRGVVFRRAFSTCASCAPARSGILTGMFPHSNGHWRNTFAPDVTDAAEMFGRESPYGGREAVGVHEDIPTLVEILNEAGYATGITQKWHLSPVWKYPFGQRLGASSQPGAHGQAARKFLAGGEGKPFFLMACIGNTHRPYSQGIVPIDAPRVSASAIEAPANLPDTPLLRSDLAQYLDTVQCADACAGAIIEALKEAGREEDTLIIFTGDQGYCYHRAKATSYYAGAAAPLIVAGPGVARARESSQLASHIDLMPTILNYLGLPIPQTVQGRSLRPLLEGGDDGEWRGEVFFEHNAHGPGPAQFYPCRSVFDGRWHYIRNLRAERRWEGELETLLNLETWPEELRFAGCEDAFLKARWDNHSFEATVRA